MKFGIRVATAGMAAVALASAVATGSAAAQDVGVSVSISQPGVYGRVDIGRFPQPQVVYQQPVLVARPPVVVARPEPVYMWVPPGHRKKWSRYCAQYGACGMPVYFVQDGWYERQVRRDGPPGGGQRDERRGHDDGPRNGHDRGHGHKGGRDH